jgi:hypothetical protein
VGSAAAANPVADVAAQVAARDKADDKNEATA